ncbi:hypothetical protein BFL34_01720 [Clavibacter michiganensis]|uniref:Uncharacterized protein n=1 Tax=Clavibacter michiganensis TaxID=28447 RepID=A0A251Y9J1_9MICO|nr:hypothetical protein BFL34_01720 [Clavibacter michiganensis]
MDPSAAFPSAGRDRRRRPARKERTMTAAPRPATERTAPPPRIGTYTSTAPPADAGRYTDADHGEAPPRHRLAS